MRTGTLWASLTQVKIGLTFARPWLSGWALAILMPRAMLARFVQGGIVPTTTNAVICEKHRTRNRPEAAELAQLYTRAAPNYRTVIESYQRAQQAAQKHA